VSLGGGATLGALALIVNVASCGGSSSVTTTPEASDLDVSLSDSPAETSVPDARPDVVTDAGDGGDGNVVGDADAMPEAAPIIPDAAPDFLHTFASSICGLAASCCKLGAAFDTTKCENNYALGPFSLFGVGSAAPYLDGGRLAYDQQAAGNCLQLTSQLTCGQDSTTLLDAIQRQCTAAIPGIVPIAPPDGGSPCASSYECAPSGYCTVELAPGDDSGVGNCQALVADGGACTTDNQCSYLALGVPGFYCGAGGTCIPRQDAGTACTSNTACASNLCECVGTACASTVCSTALVVGLPAVCTYLTRPDAGDGG
jgi:hypothetical protein